MGSVHQHGQTFPLVPGQDILADAVLKGHQRVATGLLDANRHLIAHGRGGSAFLGLIGKYPQVMKTVALHKVHKGLKMFLRFAGKAHHHGGAQGRVGEAGADAVHHGLGIGRARPPHAAEHIGMGVLQRHIEVRNEGAPAPAR